MKANQKKVSPALIESPAKDNDKSKNEGEEYKGEGHGHDYSLPVAGEDGGTEDQSGSEDKKSGKSPNKSQHSEQGKTVGEQSGI